MQRSGGRLAGTETLCLCLSDPERPAEAFLLHQQFNSRNQNLQLQSLSQETSTEDMRRQRGRGNEEMRRQRDKREGSKEARTEEMKTEDMRQAAKEASLDDMRRQRGQGSKETRRQGHEEKEARCTCTVQDQSVPDCPGPACTVQDQPVPVPLRIATKGTMESRL